MSDAAVRGQFVWHDLMTTDTKSAATFFSKVVGWRTQAWANDPSYTMFTAKDRPTAGLMALPDDAKSMGARSSWVTYIGTPDVDETARRAVTLGGKILKQPADIPTIGRFAVLHDPQGATFAIFTPKQGQPDSAPAAGDFSWHELVTTDWKAALAFYQQLFGWEATTSMDMGEMGTYQMYGWKERTLGGMFNKSAQMPGPPYWLPYIKVGDAKKAAATVKQLGAQIIHGPAQVPGGDWIAQGIDLQGAMFAVHSAKAATGKKPAANAKRPAAKKAATKRTATKRPAARKAAAPKRTKTTKRTKALKPKKPKTSKKGRATKKPRR